MGLVQSILKLLRFNQRNWKAVVLSILAATLFWLFNALNKTHSANISFPLEFEYDREKFVPVSPLPDRIRLNVTGMGWELLRKSSGLKVNPLFIPLERPSEVKKIVGSTLPPLFATQLKNLQVNYVLTDTLFIDVDNIKQRVVMVKLDSAGQYVALGYLPSGNPVFHPDSVVIHGPAKLVAALPPVLQLRLPYWNLKTTFSDEVEIHLPHPSLTAHPPAIQLTLPVEPWREVTLKLPIEINNLPAGFKPQLEINEISCVVRLPASLPDSLVLRQFKAVLDLKDYPRGTHKIVPTLSPLPPYIRVVRTDTLSVKF